MLHLNEHGLLTPSGLTETTLNEVELQFVVGMPLSSNRAFLFDQLVAFVDDVQTVVEMQFNYWLDGSFATTKLNPNDVDPVLFIDHQRHSQFNRELDRLRSTQRPLIDSYFVPIYPVEHEKRKLFELSYTEWLYVFGTTRNYLSEDILSLKS